MKGTVRNDGAGVYAWLCLGREGSTGYDDVVPVPITRKGTILELVNVPSWCCRILLKFDGDCEDQAGWSLSVMPVSFTERVWRMLRRVVPMFYNHHRRKRLRAGLTITRVLLNLQEAYRIAGSFRAYAPQMSYPDWLHAFDRLSRRDMQQIRRHIARFKHPPQVSVFVAIDQTVLDGLPMTLYSLMEQLFPVSSVVLLVAEGTDAARLAATTALFTRLVFHEVSADFALFDLVPEGRNHWVVQVRSGDRLAAHALYWVVAELETSNAVRLAYADDDQLDEAGNRAVPRFKPDWSLELLRSVDYIGSCFAFSGELLYRATFAGVSWGAEGTYGLLLRLVDALERGETVRHIPALLCHHPASQPDQVLGVGSALCAHLERRGVSARVSKTASGVLRVSYDLLQQPLVSIIVPTRDSLEMLHTCLDSVFARSSYRNFEVVLVDNQSVEAATHAYFEAITTQAQVSLLHYAAPFNYSAMNNLGVAEARGEVICLLNNDTEVITPDWLEEMLGHLLQNGVGAVGAKLLYPDGRVQHAGDTVGPGGCAHHLHSFIDKNAPGYCSRAIAAQDLSAVTAACMMTWRWLYLQLGGFDEQQLKVAFNDVDYCLRVREAGYRVVWTPHAQLYHHESASRGKNNTPEKIKHSKKEADYMRKKWRHLMQQDPFYNPNCSYERPDFSLSNAPMVRKPWQRA